MSSSAAVLVTRPAGAAEELCTALVSKGYTAYQQPLLELYPLPVGSPQIRSSTAALEGCQHLLFISGNAVRYGMAAIHAHKAHIPQGVRVYAIGQRTANMLREYDLDPVIAGPDSNTLVSEPKVQKMTSESLLALASLQKIAGQNVTIVKGEGGRTTLRDTLSARGAKVSELACYQRKCPQLKAGELADKLSRWNIEVILLSSGEGFSNMLALLSPPETIKLYTKPLIAPSARVARMAMEAGFSRVYEAENATNEAMLDAVEQLQL